MFNYFVDNEQLHRALRIPDDKEYNDKIKYILSHPNCPPDDADKYIITSVDINNLVDSYFPVIPEAWKYTTIDSNNFIVLRDGLTLETLIMLSRDKDSVYLVTYYVLKNFNTF